MQKVNLRGLSLGLYKNDPHIKKNYGQFHFLFLGLAYQN